MIHFIVATHPEAKPFIDFFKLKKRLEVTEFEIYKNTKKNISLTISGIGKYFSAISVTHTFFEFGAIKNNIWINFGLAGHKTLKIGEIAIVNKISDINNDKMTFFPFCLKNHCFQNKNCITYESQNYKLNNSLSDMECSGFFFSANKYSTKELIHSIKFISDNEKHSIDFKNKKIIYDLIFKNICKVERFIKEIHEIQKKNFAIDNKLEKIIKKFSKKKKITLFQKNELKKLLQIYFLKYDKFNNDLYIKGKNPKAQIESLKKDLDYEF